LNFAVLNILIAVVNNVFTKVTEESEDAFWVTRLKFIREVNAIRNYMLQILKRNNMELCSKPQVVDKGKIRIVFAQYDDNWMKNDTKDEDSDMYDFFKWWYYSWKEDRPSRTTRLWYFYKYASFREILYPGDVFQNIFFGLKYDEKILGMNASIAVVLSFIHLAIGIVITLAIFILGLFTCGLSWPHAMKEMLFSGPVESDAYSKVGESGYVDQQTKILGLEHEISDLQKQNTSIHQQNDKILEMLSKMQQSMENSSFTDLSIGT
jgi:hypothetical protein